LKRLQNQCNPESKVLTLRPEPSFFLLSSVLGPAELFFCLLSMIWSKLMFNMSPTSAIFTRSEIIVACSSWSGHLSALKGGPPQGFSMAVRVFEDLPLGALKLRF
jgi:hypothetical protein